MIYQEKKYLFSFFFFWFKKKNKRRKRLHKSAVENIAKILLIVALNFSRFQTICHVKNVIERGTPWQALQKFHTEQYEVSLRQLHERIRPETKPPHALEIRVRPTAPLQMPLLWSDLEEDVQHTEAYTPETRGERGLRSGYLSTTKSDCLNHAFVVLFYLLNSFLFFFFFFLSSIFRSWTKFFFFSFSSLSFLLHALQCQFVFIRTLLLSCDFSPTSDWGFTLSFNPLRSNDDSRAPLGSITPEVTLRHHSDLCSIFFKNIASRIDF